MTDADILDPGIRSTVEKIRDWGFITCDSGDGSKAGTMEGALGFPHVHCGPYSGRVGLQEADRLFALAGEHGQVQATYDPLDGSCIVSFFGTIP